MKNIVVIWDIMLDKYTYGSVDRISPEAPVPVVKVEKIEYKLWWAANVAANLSSLWQDVSLIWILWNDPEWDVIQNLCSEKNISIKAIKNWYSTTVKNRIVWLRQQMLRLDTEYLLPLEEKHANEIIDYIKDTNPDIIIISDYLKWVVTEYLINKVKENSDAKILVDTKPSHLDYFDGVFLIKPNFKEFCQMVWKDIKKNDSAEVEKYWKLFTQKYNTNLIVTRSEYWASIVENNWQTYHIPTEAKDIIDVSWAWDTFLAALATWINMWYKLEDAVKLANKASGIAVGKIWTAVVTKEELGI